MPFETLLNQLPKEFGSSDFGKAMAVDFDKEEVILSDKVVAFACFAYGGGLVI